MKTVLITNIANESIEITSNDYQKFLEVIMFDNNRESCEIYNNEKTGWISIATMLDEIEQKEINLYGEDFESQLENLFDNHLFASEIHGTENC